MSDVWIVIAYTPPPRKWGFQRAKSGKCYWRKIEGKQWAVELGRQLAEIHIHGKISREKPRSARAKSKPQRASKMAIPDSVSSQLAAMIKEQFEVYKAEIATPQHMMATALPDPINPPRKRTATSNANSVLTRGSRVNGARKL